MKPLPVPDGVFISMLLGLLALELLTIPKEAVALLDPLDMNVIPLLLFLVKSGNNEELPCGDELKLLVFNVNEDAALADPVFSCSRWRGSGAANV